MNKHIYNFPPLKSLQNYKISFQIKNIGVGNLRLDEDIDETEGKILNPLFEWDFIDFIEPYNPLTVSKLFIYLKFTKKNYLFNNAFSQDRKILNTVSFYKNMDLNDYKITKRARFLKARLIFYGQAKKIKKLIKNKKSLKNIKNKKHLLKYKKKFYIKKLTKKKFFLFYFFTLNQFLWIPMKNLCFSNANNKKILLTNPKITQSLLISTALKSFLSHSFFGIENTLSFQIIRQNILNGNYKSTDNKFMKFLFKMRRFLKKRKLKFKEKSKKKNPLKTTNIRNKNLYYILNRRLFRKMNTKKKQKFRLKPIQILTSKPLYNILNFKIL